MKLQNDSVYSRCWKFITRRAFLIRLLATTLLACLIPILLMSAINTWDRSSDMEHRLHLQTETVAESVVTQFENCMDTILELDSRIAVDRNLLNLSQRPTISGERSLLNSLGDLNYTLPFAEEFGMYIPGNPGGLYMSGGKYQPDTFAQEVLRIDSRIFTEKLETLNEGSFIPWSEESRVSVYLHPIRIYYTSQTSQNMAIGVYAFSHVSISTLFRNSLPEGYGIASIYSPDEMLIYRSPSSPLEADGIPAKTRYLDESTGIAYLLGTAIGSKGYRCTVYVREDALNQNILYYSNLSRLFIAIACMFCVVLVGLMITVNYLPIQRLLRRVGHYDEREEDEFSYIHSVLAQRETEASRLKEALAQQKLDVVDYAFDRALGGGKLSAKDRAILERSAPQYFVVAVRLNDVRDVDVILDQNTPDGEIYAVELYREGYLALVCRCEGDEDGARARALSMLDGADTGVSGSSSGADGMREAFEEACRRLRETENSSGAQVRSEPESPTDITSSMLVDYVDGHFTDPDFGVSSAADYLGISEYTTGKLLRNVYGTNFRRVINEKRIAFAKTQLMTTDDSVSQIGKRSGFMSTSYFIKVFREAEGITPTQLRQMAEDS